MDILEEKSSSCSRDEENKDKKVSVELTSVFELLLNNPFSKNGGTDEARTRDLLRDRQTL